MTAKEIKMLKKSGEIQIKYTMATEANKKVKVTERESRGVLWSEKYIVPISTISIRRIVWKTKKPFTPKILRKGAENRG